MTKRKIIIDTDPGVDDAFAIALASKYKNFEILGITSSMGNKGLETTTSNCIRLAKYFDINCKVYKGENEYVTKGEKSFSQGVHGDDGLSGVSKDLEYDENILSDEKAVDFILESVKKYPNEIEIIALAPLTNIAYAINKDFETMKKVKAIYSMGGAIEMGNVTPYAEFNYYADPEAVEIVYSLGKYVDTYMFGLNVTHNSMLTCNDLAFVKQDCGELGKVLYEISTSYQDAYWKFRKMLGCVMHDMLVVAYMINSEICENVKKAVLTTEIYGDKKGISKFDFNCEKNKNVLVATSVNPYMYKKTFIETVFGEEKMKQYELSIKQANESEKNFSVKIN